MLNRFAASACLLLLATLLPISSGFAQEMRQFAVLPFEYNGPDKFKYLPKAFQATLNNDLDWPGQVAPAADAVVDNLAVPKNAADAITILRGSEVEYLVTGTISILGKDAALTMSAYAENGDTWTQKGNMSIDEITPWLETQSRAIMGDVFKRPGYSTAEQSDETTDIQDGVRAGPAANAAFIPATGTQGGSAALNPQFRYEGGAQNVGRWRSQTLRFPSTSMTIGDGDGDGKNEVFLLTSTGISAYRFVDGKLKHLATMELTTKTMYIRLEMADLDRDGVDELIVGSYQMEPARATRAPEGTPRSHILSFNGGKFKFLLKDHNQFLGVLRMPPTYMPILVEQKKGHRDLFDDTIYEAYFKGDDIVRGQAVPTPPFGSIYGMTYLPDEFGYKFVVLDNEHRIKVYSQTLEALHSSGEDTYNSSGIAIEVSQRMVGMGPGSVDENPNIYNVPFRMIAAKLTDKTKYELLVNKDLSVAAQLFKRYTYYSQGEIHSLAWDGVGMNLAWKTRRIKGQVADLGLADLNNDGNKQLCVLVNTFPGGVTFGDRKTIVLAYDLNL